MSRAGKMRQVARHLLRRLGRSVRTSRAITLLRGPQFRPATDLIEIDITFACNLRCFNCDRSCTQAPDGGRMTVEQIQRFVAESREQGRQWRRIRILGGEPTLHPEIEVILKILLAWRDESSPGTLIELVTNGHGDRVRRVLERIPEGVRVKNTGKEDRFQPQFEPFNLAPCDDGLLRYADFSNGCWITLECGIGLNAYGYYPCAVAGGIDRVFGGDIGRKRLPSLEDPMVDLLRESCARCGHFQNGCFVPREARSPVEGEPRSKTWRDAYHRYGDARPVLTRY
jgi:hypothetical protein